MKKILLLAILFLSLSIPSRAQTHSASLSWTPSVTAGVSGQNVYRANCAGTVTAGACSTDSTATFTKLAAGTNLGPTIASFTDSTVAGGSAYIYYVTAVCPATGACQGESVPSGHVATVIPGTPPNPPTGLSLTSVALVINPDGTQTVTAKWTDTNLGVGQSFLFSDGKKVVNQGLTSSTTGTFAEIYKSAPGTVFFSVCDALGQCVSRQAM
jgi:hypothetical protein